MTLYLIWRCFICFHRYYNLYISLKIGRALSSLSPERKPKWEKNQMSTKFQKQHHRHSMAPLTMRKRVHGNNRWMMSPLNPFNVTESNTAHGISVHTENILRYKMYTPRNLIHIWMISNNSTNKIVVLLQDGDSMPFKLCFGLEWTLQNIHSPRTYAVLVIHVHKTMIWTKCHGMICNYDISYPSYTWFVCQNHRNI